MESDEDLGKIDKVGHLVVHANVAIYHLTGTCCQKHQRPESCLLLTFTMNSLATSGIRQPDVESIPGGALQTVNKVWIFSVCAPSTLCSPSCRARAIS